MTEAIKAGSICKHCGNWFRSTVKNPTARGLCQPCYCKRAVRDLYPLVGVRYPDRPKKECLHCRKMYAPAREMRGLCKACHRDIEIRQKYRVRGGASRWGEADEEILRESYGKVTADELATRLGRSVGSVHVKAQQLGIQTTLEVRRDISLKRRTAECEQCGRIFMRRKLSRQRLAMVCSRKCNGESRRQMYREFARKNGWPEGLGTRHVQVMNLLAAVGLPVTLNEMEAALKLTYSSVNTAVSHLQQEQLVAKVQLGRAGKGRSTYCLSTKALGILEERAKCEAAATP